MTPRHARIPDGGGAQRYVRYAVWAAAIAILVVAIAAAAWYAVQHY